MNRKHLTLFGLKWNPFSPEAPAESFFPRPALESFRWRIENLAQEGGFSLLTGDPGVGKSVALRLLVEQLSQIPDLRIAVLTRPQSSSADFYRELGELFEVSLKPHNRWAGAKVLRQQWQTHFESVLYRAVLIVDEAQEMSPSVLSELRLLSASELDSRTLLTVVLAGDSRLPDRFRTPELLPLGSRIRVRLHLGPASPKELKEILQHLLESAGNPDLLTEELARTLCEHATGNLRVLMTLANELLDAGMQRKVQQLDENLYFEVYGDLGSPRPARRGKRAAAR